MMTKDFMMTEYDKHSVADSYVIGFAEKHMLYMAEVKTLPAYMLTVETASRNQGESLRLRIRHDMKLDLILTSAICLGTDELLVSEKYNKGEMFEKAVTEHYGQVWEKDNIPFWVQGDIKVDNKEVQIKFDGASIITSSLIAKLGA